jgi:hypothetical protein
VGRGRISGAEYLLKRDEWAIRVFTEGIESAISTMNTAGRAGKACVLSIEARQRMGIRLVDSAYDLRRTERFVFTVVKAMKIRRGILAVAMVLAGVSSAKATQSITATFENFSAGQSFQPSFTDPLSGIHFRNSTNFPAPGGFVIDFSPTYFGGGNYLTAGGIAVGALGGNFGFTADLPLAANEVDLDVMYVLNSPTNVLLQGFNTQGTLVAQQAGQTAFRHQFNLAINSANFDISTFKVSVDGGAAGYDNISFVVVPEPTYTLLLTSGAMLGLMRRRRH